MLVLGVGDEEITKCGTINLDSAGSRRFKSFGSASSDYRRAGGYSVGSPKVKYFTASIIPFDISIPSL